MLIEKCGWDKITTISKLQLVSKYSTMEKLKLLTKNWLPPAIMSLLKRL